MLAKKISSGREAAIRFLYALKCTAGSVDIGTSTFANVSEFCRSVSRTAFNSSSAFEGNGGAGVCARTTAEVETARASWRRVNFVSRFSGSWDIWTIIVLRRDKNEKRQLE